MGEYNHSQMGSHGVVGLSVGQSVGQSVSYNQSVKKGKKSVFSRFIMHKIVEKKKQAKGLINTGKC